MKLLDLDPHWVSPSRWDDANGTQHFWDQPPRRCGVSFYCPVHTRKCDACGQLEPQSHRLVVWFANPADGLPPQQGIEHLWTRTGETFETLTLSPSIDASKYLHADGSTCWHGHISNGEIK